MRYSKHMRDIIVNQPQQIIRSLEVNKDACLPAGRSKSIDGIILAGLGGSAQPGDLLTALNLTTVPVMVHRSYDLPQTPFKKPLVILSSHSGNTEETLSAYQAAKAKGYAMLINTSGGKLAELAVANNVPISKIDFPALQPRHTLLASFTSLITTLANSGLATDIQAELQSLASYLKTVIPTQEAAGQALAKKLTNKTPVYYASQKLAFTAFNFKIQTNENVKTTAFWNYFPELNHNEMLGYTQPKGNYHVVLLQDADDHPRIKARMAVTADLLQQWGTKVSTVEIKGNSLLEKIFTTVCFGLWTTYFLAKAYGIDPVPVAQVEDFKKRLADHP